MMTKETDMNLWEAIRGRRSIGKVKPDPLDREQIELLLEYASWAPNHYLTEPWRFFVMTGEGRQRLSDAYADIAAEAGQGVTGAELEALRQQSGSKAFRAPVVIAVAVSPSVQPHVSRMEEFAAVHAALQNMLLAAHGLGLGAIWRTGEPAYHPRMKQAFGLNESEQIAGFVYVGYPAITQPQGKREPFTTKTVWLAN